MIRVPHPFSMPAVLSYAAVALFALVFRPDAMADQAVLSILAGASGATLATLIESRWELLAKFLAWRPVADRIIALSSRLEHFDIVNDDGSVYMERAWVFNPHPRDAKRAKYDWIPFGIRLHHILRRDSDRARHNHPWPRFRTFILRGWYQQDCGPAGDNELNAGDTALVRASDYHRIFCVPPEGVWTLVITGRRVSDWGFDVNGKHVPHAEYLAKKPRKLTAADNLPEDVNPWVWIEEGVTEMLDLDSPIEVMFRGVGRTQVGTVQSLRSVWDDVVAFRPYRGSLE